MPNFFKFVFNVLTLPAFIFYTAIINIDEYFAFSIIAIIFSIIFFIFEIISFIKETKKG